MANITFKSNYLKCDTNVIFYLEICETFKTRFLYRMLRSLLLTRAQICFEFGMNIIDQDCEFRWLDNSIVISLLQFSKYMLVSSAEVKHLFQSFRVHCKRPRVSHCSSQLHMSAQRVKVGTKIEIRLGNFLELATFQQSYFSCNNFLHNCI